MALPYPTKVVLPFDIATAQDMNERHANDVALANGTGLDDGAVTNAKLATGAGEPGGAWTSWTPSYTGLSGGSLDYAKFMQIGKTVHYRFKYTLGGAGVSGAVTITLPAAMHGDYATSLGEPFGTANFRDAGTANLPGVVYRNDANSITVRRVSAGISEALTSTQPFTWAIGDQIYATGTYEAA